MLANRDFISALAFIASAFAAIPAMAQDCRLQRVANFELRPDWSVPVVQVGLNGLPKYLIVDTGGFRSTISEATARELDLRIKQQNSYSIVGVTGRSTPNYVSVEQFQIGNGVLPFDFFLDPNDSGEISDTDPIGTLGPEVLRIFDADFDFGSGTMNLFTQDHCEGQVLYWRPQTVAVVPFSIDDSNHIELSVTVDGEELFAILDTGASYTVMNRNIAVRYFDFDPDSPGVEEAGELTGAYTAAVYRLQFESLALEGLSVANPVIHILPDLMAPRSDFRISTGNLIAAPPSGPSLPDLILGMSILSRLHVYVAYGENKLYVSSAEAPAAP